MATRVLTAGAFAALLAGCLSFGQQEPQRYYVLEPDGKARPNRPANPRATTLLVAPTSASAFYETAEIAYSRAPGERAYYQLSSWTEHPSRRITGMLIARLEGAGSFETIAYAASGVQGDLVLNTHLTAFYHDATTPPGRVHVALTAELIDPQKRALVARRSFEQSAPAATYDAAGAVGAFNRATAAILDDIAAWIEATAPR
ncbi:MAG TPA: ABC-type transport auxiliary lipoprotein family protein [Burkholderiales bacterium]|nr:ABC-type transport auxiliary lipoprotein family protein [Burkholderiales bacterium]